MNADELLKAIADVLDVPAGTPDDVLRNRVYRVVAFVGVAGLFSDGDAAARALRDSVAGSDVCRVPVGGGLDG